MLGLFDGAAERPKARDPVITCIMLWRVLFGGDVLSPFAGGV